MLGISVRKLAIESKWLQDPHTNARNKSYLGNSFIRFDEAERYLAL